MEEPPIVKPLTTEVGSAMTSALPVPAMVDQAPVPVVGVFPAKTDVITLHKFWSGPAVDVVGAWSIWIHIVSTEFGHTPLDIVHVKVSVLPIVSPVTADVGSVTVVTVDAPKITDQLPVPTTGAFPAKVEEVTLHNV